MSLNYKTFEILPFLREGVHKRYIIHITAKEVQSMDQQARNIKIEKAQ